MISSDFLKKYSARLSSAESAPLHRADDRDVAPPSLNMVPSTGGEGLHDANACMASSASDIESIVSQIESLAIDITAGYDTWLRILFALADYLGEGGRVYAHRISRFHPSYKFEECDKQYNCCIRSGKSGITIRTLFYYALQHGISVNTSALFSPSFDELMISLPEYASAESLILPISKSSDPSVTSSGSSIPESSISPVSQPPYVPSFNAGEGAGLLRMLRTEASNPVTPRNENDFEVGFFRCRTANQCIEDARNQPVPVDLFHSLWFENELTILFADTGIGKSVFAVQMGDAISQSRKVLYIDLEQSDKNFHKRYSQEYKNEYVFNPNFQRVTFKSRYAIPKGITYEEYFILSLVELLKMTGAKVVIIDNMTKLISSDTDKAQNAKPLMDRLTDLKFDYGLSILCLEHTRKTNSSQPISLNDLQGSKMKSNFADAAFTIGRSNKDTKIRYVKQLKARSCEVLYDSENIIVYEFINNTNFIHFRFIEYGSEPDHLKLLDENEKSARVEQILALHSRGLSNRAIAQQLNITEGAIRKCLKKHA